MMVDDVRDVCERVRDDSNALGVVMLHPALEMGTSPAFIAIIKSARETFGHRLVTDGECSGTLDGAQLHVLGMAEGALLAVIFDQRSSLGLVRLRAKKASATLTRILKNA